MCSSIGKVRRKLRVESEARIAADESMFAEIALSLRLLKSTVFPSSIVKVLLLLRVRVWSSLPAAGVWKVTLPLPSVVNTWPLVPSVVGKVNSFPTDSEPNILIESEAKFP